MREGVVTIDGSHGEGGGQILRTSLALSMITGRRLQIRNLRAGRAKPGLRRQHLACVNAAAASCGATVHGAEVGSRYLDFVPGPIVGGDLAVDIGTAGSTTLVVQTVLVPVLAAGRGLRMVVRGGTHNPMAPPFEFLDRVFLPHLRAMGADVQLTLDRHGFASGGAHRAERSERELGQITLEVGPTRLRPLEIVEVGPVVARKATALLARLPTHVAERELAIVRDRLGFAQAECEVRDISGEGGPGNALMLEIERRAGDHPVRELVTGFGERGVRAELVAERACDELSAYLAAEVPVGEHLADQLLLPLAIAGGGRFRCAPLSRHATTNIETIGHFLDVPIGVDRQGTADIVAVGA